MNVERLLEPFSFAQFLDAYYEKQPLHIRRQSPGYYDGLLTLSTVDAHLSVLEQEGFRLDPEEESLFARFYRGDTIEIDSYEQHRGPVLHLHHDLERGFHAPVETCVVLTPRDAAGSSVRADDDLLILQFAGSRDWIVDESTVAIEPGDFLYVPAGVVHEACSAPGVSGHLSFTLEKFTYADLLRQIADNAHCANPWLRKSLPADRRSVTSNGDFLQHAHEFFDEADLSAYLERMHSDFAEERMPDSTNRLADYVKLASIGPASRFRRRTGIWPELKKRRGKVVLTFHRKSLEFPAAAAQSLRYVIDAEEFVTSAVPGNGEESLALCATLVREGFLTVVE